MKYKQIFKTIFAVSPLVGMLLATVSPITLAEDTEVEPLALRTIMQNMGKNMQSITDGISREDWKKVAENAPLIADHPQPPLLEKIRILSFIGSDVSKFKGYDQDTHLTAQELEGAAIEQDGEAVIAVFAKLQNHCLSCHQHFRKPFLEHFYRLK